MVYILNLIFTVGYSFFVKKIKILYFIPILSVWIIILGGQYEVGTDYNNYLKFFYGIRDIRLFFLQKEYIFYYFMKIISNIFSNGQVLFVLISGVESFIFIIFIKKCEQLKFLKKENLFIFMFLYLGYGTLFYNQMNTLRQSFNVYLFSISVLYILQKKIKFSFLVNIIAIFIHRSTYLLFPFYFIYYFIFRKIDKKMLYYSLLIGSFVISLFNIIAIIEPFIFKYVPSFKIYFLAEKVKEVSFEKKILKYIYLPFYFLSINLIEKKKKEKEILKIGIVAYSIRILTSNIGVVVRMGEYFVLLSIFPIYYLIEDWLKRKKYFFVLFFISMILGIFILKVTIFATGEYYYRSYLLN